MWVLVDCVSRCTSNWNLACVTLATIRKHRLCYLWQCPTIEHNVDHWIRHTFAIRPMQLFPSDFTFAHFATDYEQGTWSIKMNSYYDCSLNTVRWEFKSRNERWNKRKIVGSKYLLIDVSVFFSLFFFLSNNKNFQSESQSDKRKGKIHIEMEIFVRCWEFSTFPVWIWICIFVCDCIISLYLLT